MASSVKVAVFLSIGLGLVITGAVLGWYGFPTIIDNMINKEMVLTNDSVSFDPWKAPTSKVDVYMQFIMFNVTNPDEIVANTSRPKVEEVGPFSFKENRERVNLTWSEDGTELTYYEQITYVFDEATSGDGLTADTPIVTINAIMVVLAAMAEDLGGLKFLVENIINSKERGAIFKEYKAAELLMSGVEDEALKFIVPLAPTLVPPIYAGGLFMLYPYNGTLDGPYTINTGSQDIDRFTYIESYKGNASLSYWGSAECNMINGTDGITYPPNTGDVDRVYIFNKDLCRSIYLDYEKDVKYFGIHGRRFRPIRDVLEDPNVNKDNQCFCVPAGNCFKAGTMSLAPCQYGAPIIASTPHFYMGAQEYVDAIEGLSPDKNRHETFIDIEPYTGLALNGGKKIQINLQVKPYARIHGMQNLREMLFPITYTNETAKIDQSGADEFNSELGRPLKLLKAGQWILIGVGALCLLAGAALIVMTARASKRGKQTV